MKNLKKENKVQWPRSKDPFAQKEHWNMELGALLFVESSAKQSHRILEIDRIGNGGTYDGKSEADL